MFRDKPRQSHRLIVVRASVSQVAGDGAIHLGPFLCWMLPSNDHDDTQKIGLGPQVITGKR